MREKVCLVLNERESAKAKAATALEKHLNDLGITTSRLKITEGVERALKERPPQVVVIDYLLGDYSTGLDIMSALGALPESRRPKFLFFTDEPSVHVAVEAVRKGAITFVELDDPQALTKLSQEIQALIGTPPSAPRSVPTPLSLDELVWNSSAGSAFQQRALDIIRKETPVTVLFGPSGSGVSTVANALHQGRTPPLPIHRIDLRFFSGDIIDVLGLRTPRPRRASFGNNLSLIIENIEEDDGEILSCITALPEHFWSSIQASTLTLCTHSEETLRGWLSFSRASLLRIPSLEERKDDISAFVQRFSHEAEAFTGKKSRALPSDTLAWIKSLDWPGQLTQLRSCIIDAVIAAQTNEADYRQSIELLRSVWEEQRHYRQAPISPSEAAFAYAHANYNLKRAAVNLGCSARDLLPILQEVRK